MASVLVNRRLTRPIAAAACALVAAITLPAAAQTAAVVAGKGPGVVAAARHVSVSATITAIDSATRAVTLRVPQSGELTVLAGPEVKNFSQMRVSDRVDVEYVEELSLVLRKGGGKAVARSEAEGAATARPGERPGQLTGRRTTIVADVVDVSAATQAITLRGPERTLEVNVPDREQFQRIVKGDQVEATYTETLALKVVPSPAN